MTSTLTLNIADTPGSLGRTARVLSTAGINIDAFQADGGTCRFIVADGPKASAALRKAGIPCQANDCLEVRLPNQPGQLASLGEALGKAGVNIQSSFGATGDGRVFLQVDKPAAAQPVLERFGGTIPAGTGPSR